MPSSSLAAAKRASTFDKQQPQQQQHMFERKVSRSIFLERHYEPGFSEFDPKWLLLNRWHVQKTGPWAALLCFAVAILLAVVGILLLRLPHLLWSWLALCLLLLLVSGLSLFAALRHLPALLLPFILVMFAFCLLWFTMFFCLLAMIATPEFWQQSLHAALNVGTGNGRPSVAVVRLVTIAGMLLAFLLLSLFTILNSTMLRTRNFLIAKKLANQKSSGRREADDRGDGSGKRKRGDKVGARKGSKKQVEMLETVA